MATTNELTANPLINYYYTVYPVGAGLCAEAIKRFGDTKRTHRFLEFCLNVKKNCPNYDFSTKTFDEIYKDYSISQAS